MKDLTKTELNVLLDVTSDCIECNSMDMFYGIIAKFENLLQFTNIVFLSSQKKFPSNALTIQEINVSYPTEWTKIYRSQNYIDIDPIITSGNTGLLYWQDIYSKVIPDQEFYSQANAFGLINGFSHILASQQAFGVISIAGVEVTNSTRTRAILNYLAPHFHQLVQHLTNNQTREKIPHLTPREREVLLWAMEGKSNWEISVILNIGQESIKHHIANILKKLGASNRAHAVAIAAHYKLLFTSELH